MGLTYKEFWSELLNAIPRLGNFYAQRFVNRAWHDIQNSRQWSFLNSTGILFSPQLIQTGTFQVTQFSNQVIASASAITALNNLTNPVLTKRQIRFGSGSTPIYNISVIDPSFASNGILYLDRIYMEASNTIIGYRVYRAYYNGPQITTVAANGTPTTVETTDFLRYTSIYIPTNSRYFRSVNLPIELLNKLDPQRSRTSNLPYYLFASSTIRDSNNIVIPVFEIWPHSTSALPMQTVFQRRGLDFQSQTETLPSIIPDELLMERALFYACSWANKNQSRYPELKGTNWNIMTAAHKLTYSNISNRDPGLLELAMRDDEESFPQNQITVDNRGPFPFGDDDLMTYESINIA